MEWKMQVYKTWWIKKDRNFGDILTPYILDYFQIPYTYSKLRRNADIMCIGSIADRAESDTIVLGSGILKSKEPVCKDANWKFVRGPLTRKKIIDCGGYCPEIYGDPALFLSEFLPKVKITHNIGIVPHFVDYEYVLNKYKNTSYKIINVVNDNPLEVAKEISSCEYIISSSLHGIICAHAYNIPAAWAEFNKKKYHGDQIKYFDYYASLDLHPKLSTVENPEFQLGSPNLSPARQIFNSL